MYITQQTDYAFKILIYTAIHKDELVNINDIAITYDISRNHLMKVVPLLVKGGYLFTIRGNGGGIKLAKDTNDINIGKVFKYMENIPKFDYDYEHCKCLVDSSMKLDSFFVEAFNSFLTSLEKYTLKDVLSSVNKNSIKQLKEFKFKIINKTL